MANTIMYYLFIVSNRFILVRKLRNPEIIPGTLDTMDEMELHFKENIEALIHLLGGGNLGRRCKSSQRQYGVVLPGKKLLTLDTNSINIKRLFTKKQSHQLSTITPF